MSIKCYKYLSTLHLEWENTEVPEKLRLPTPGFGQPRQLVYGGRREVEGDAGGSGSGQMTWLRGCDIQLIWNDEI